MAGLPQEVLRGKLQAALPKTTTFTSAHDETRPAIVEAPSLGTIRVYLWTITHVESQDRPADEYKIQLILPDQERGQSGELELNDSEQTVLLGYSADYGVFVGWEAALHKRFAYSSAVQVKEELLVEARSFGWAVAAPRALRGRKREVRVAFSPGNLINFIRASQAADRRTLSGPAREAFFLYKTPKITLPSLPKKDVALAIPSLRERLKVSRLKRDSKFGPKVREQYAHACALCSVRLNVVEGAHIIPINEEESEDEIWNGVALCCNHHRLFDASAFVIQPSLKVKLDTKVITFLKECDRAVGMDTLLTPFENKKIQKPFFYTSDVASRNKMREALAWRESLAAIQ